MTAVRIAELKSRLSEHLRQVRGGRVITVLDRDTPVAQIVPFEPASAALTIRMPAPGSPPLHAVPLPPPLRLDRDVAELLLEERARSG